MDTEKIQQFATYLEILTVKNKKLKYYYMWLRDHCRCAECYNTATAQVLSDVIAIPLTIKPTNCEINGGTLKITWFDGHKTEYAVEWLTKLTFPLQSKKEVVLWDTNNVLSFEDTKIPVNMYLENDDGPRRLLQSVLKYGFGFVTDVEPTIETTEAIVKRIATVQKTLFGEMWTLANENQHSDTAYTNIALNPHTDNTYFNEAAGLQVFHLISHEGTGGETLLVDGFNAANNLRNKNQESFKTLCTTPIESQYIEKGYYFSTIQPVITLHATTKDLFQIRYNTYDRATLDSIPEEQIPSFYKAYKEFGTELLDAKNEYKFKLNPGSVLFIDNWRVLHGRADFTGARKLCGCYISRSEWLSKAKYLNLPIV